MATNKKGYGIFVDLEFENAKSAEGKLKSILAKLQKAAKIELVMDTSNLKVAAAAQKQVTKNLAEQRELQSWLNKVTSEKAAAEKKMLTAKTNEKKVLAEIIALRNTEIKDIRALADEYKVVLLNSREMKVVNQQLAAAKAKNHDKTATDAETKAQKAANDVLQKSLTMIREETQLKKALIKAGAEESAVIQQRIALIQAEMLTVNSKITNTQHLKTLTEAQAAATLKVAQAQAKARDSANRVQVANQGMTISLKGFIRAAGSMVGIYSVYSLLAKAIAGATKAIMEMDAAMIDLRKVSASSEAIYLKLEQRSYDLADSLGATADAVIRATTAFARMGYQINEASKLGEKSIIFSNISRLSAEESAGAIIAAMNGFGLNVESVNRIMDAYNEVGNNFATTVGGIAEGMKRASATMSATGNTLEETVGMIAGANAVIQDEAKVGTALKTMALRLQGFDAAGKKTGEYMPKLGASFARFGIEMKKTNNQFKSTYELVGELSKVWDKNAEGRRADEQAAILQDIAGKRQATVLAALIQNWGQVSDATKTAIDSQGSSFREQMKYMESMRASVDKLANAWMKFWNALIDNDFAKGLIEGLASILNILADLIDAVGVLLPIAIGAAIAKFLIFKGVLQAQLITNLVLKIGTAITSFVTLKFGIMAATNSLYVFNTVISVLAAHPLILAATLIIGLTVALATLGKQSKKTASDVNEVQQKMNEVASAQEAVKSIRELNDELSELSVGTIEYTDAAKELNTEQQNLAGLFPQLINGFDKEGNAIVKVTEETEKAIEAIRILNTEDAGSVYRGLAKDAKGVQKEVDDLTTKLKYQESLRKLAMKNNKDGKMKDMIIGNIDNEMSKLYTSRSEQLAILTTLAEAEANYSTSLRRSTDVQAEYAKVMELHKGDIEEYVTSVRSEEVEIKTLIDVLEKYRDELDAQKVAQDAASKSKKDAYQRAMDEEELMSRAMKEFEKNGKLERDTINEIIELLPAWADEMGFVSDEIQKLVDSHRGSSEEHLLIEKRTTEAVIAGTRARIKAMETEVTGMMLLRNSMSSSTTIEDLLNSGTNPLNPLNSPLFKTTKIETFADFSNKSQDADLEKQKAILKDSEASLVALGISLEALKTTSKSTTKQYVSDLTTFESKTKQAITAAEFQMQLLQGRLSQLEFKDQSSLDTIKSRISLLRQEEEHAQKMQKLQEIMAAAERKSRDLLKDELEDIGESVGIKVDLSLDRTSVSGLENINNLHDEDAVKRIETIIDEMKKLDTVIATAGTSWWTYGTQALGAGDKVLDMELNLARKIQDIEDDKLDKKKNILDKTVDLIEDSIDKEKDLLDKSLDDYKKTASAALQGLDKEQDEKEFARNMTKLQEEKAKIESKITETSMIDSVSARKREAALREELKDKELSILEAQEDHALQIKKDAIEDSISDQEDLTEATKDELDDRWTEEKKMAEATKALAGEMFETASGTITLIGDEYESFTQRVGGASQTAITEIQTLMAEMNKLESDKQRLSETAESAFGGGAANKNKPNYSDDSLVPIRKYIEDRFGHINEKNTNEMITWHGDDKGAEIHIKKTLDSGDDDVYKVSSEGMTNKDSSLYSTVSNLEKLLSGAKGFRNGGVADADGLAMVHGAKNKEYFLTTDQYKDLAKYIVEYGNTKARTAVDNNSFTGGRGDISIENFLKVDGNVDESTLPQLNSMKDDAIEQFAALLNKGGARTRIG